MNPILGAAVRGLSASWYDHLNPFTYLGSAAGKVVADGWTAAMLGLWNAGLWMLRVVLSFSDSLLTPDVSEAGPGGVVYRTTFWIAASLVVLMVFVQLGTAAFRRDGASLATAVVGVGKFAVVWAGWLVYGTGVVAACGGLTHALMSSLLQVDALSAWQPWTPLSTADITDGTVATILGLLGLVLWLSALGHILVMLTRAGSLIVLVAVTPICAAGLVADAGRAWFWKSLRWFHAAALSPVLMLMVLGVGVQITSGVATGLSDSFQASIGTALPGVVLILVSCFAPLALFKLLAFVDPATGHGAAMRAGLAANGGLAGLLSRGARGSANAGGSAASDVDAGGRSSAEAGAEDTTALRFGAASGAAGSTSGGGVAGALGAMGAAGALAGQGLRLAAAVGANAAAIGSDVTNQMGVGHASYQPDFSGVGPRRSDSPSGSGSGDTATV